MGKIVDTQLNVIGQISDGAIINSLTGLDFDNATSDQVASIVNNVDGDLPIGAYGMEYYLNDDSISVAGVIQLDGPNNPPASALFSTYKGGTSSGLFVTPDLVQIVTDNLAVNQQLTFTGDVLVSGTTFSIVNGFIVDVIQ